MNITLTETERAKIARDWEVRGFGCDIWADPPGQVWADFIHATDELVLLIDGEIELRLSGQVLRPAVGEEILIPAGVAHTVTNTGRTRNHWLYGYRRY